MDIEIIFKRCHVTRLICKQIQTFKILPIVHVLCNIFTCNIYWDITQCDKMLVIFWYRYFAGWYFFHTPRDPTPSSVLVMGLESWIADLQRSPCRLWIKTIIKENRSIRSRLQLARLSRTPGIKQKAKGGHNEYIILQESKVCVEVRQSSMTNQI